ncbi:MAG: ParA family protein [Desulfotignum sp.]
MGKILTISGPAGGTGKTTMAVNLAAALALYEKKVLVVDCDPREIATTWIRHTGSLHDRNLSSILKKIAEPGDVIEQTGLDRMDLVPAGFDLFYAAQSLATDVSHQTRLKQVVQQHFAADYDYIIIDSPASFGYLSVMALTAGDWVVVPLWPGRSSETDCQHLLKLIRFIRKTHHIRLRIAGFIFNGCGSAQDIQVFLKNNHLTWLSDLVFETFIPEDPAVVRAIGHHRPVVLEDINAPAGKAFLQFAMEIDSIFNREGESFEIVPGPETPATEKKSPRKKMENKERGSEKAEQLAASIANMINEINQSEEAH